MLSTLELRHLNEHFPDIDPGEVQTRLGMGIEKVAYALRTVTGVASGVKAKVLKLLRKDTQGDPISYFVSPMFTTPVDEVKSDADTCLEYFGPEVVVMPEIIQSSTRNGTYCLLQDRLEMEMLTPDLCLKHPDLLDQLRLMLEQNEKLKSDKKRFFDFQGWDIWRVMLNQVAMGNVAVVWEEQDDFVMKPRLKIFDLTLMHTPAFSARGIVHLPGYLSNERNNVRMVYYGDPANVV